MKIFHRPHLHIGILNANGSNCKALELSTGQVGNITVVDMAKLCPILGQDG